MKNLSWILVLAVLAACNNNSENSNGGDGEKPPVTPLISYSILDTFPHDTASFTEGLLFYKGDLYESTGIKGTSRIMKVDLKTGKTNTLVNLDSAYFGEGIVIINDTIYQLTYQEKVGFMYNLNGKKLGEFKFASEEGWGMATDGKQIIASDGTSNLFFYEPGTFKLLRQQGITENGAFASNINELEYIDGYVYANQWQSPYILKIDPSNGLVVAKIDLSEIANRIRNTYPYAELLNGIAYDPSSKKIYITGKHWPEMYGIQLGQ